MNLQELNKKFRHESPEVIIKWALNKASKPIITTNFRPYEGAILHAITLQKEDIDVIWCDTGYNTSQTYQHAQELIAKLKLKVDLFVPKQTVAYRKVFSIGIPDINDPEHKTFTEQVKLEPFKRALSKHQPDVWFTNLRKGQTAFRDGIDILSEGSNGILKVSPFYHWPDSELDTYLAQHCIPNEFKYFDPTKLLEHRECGLHT